MIANARLAEVPNLYVQHLTLTFDPGDQRPPSPFPPATQVEGQGELRARPKRPSLKNTHRLLRRGVHAYDTFEQTLKYDTIRSFSVFVFIFAVLVHSVLGTRTAGIFF